MYQNVPKMSKTLYLWGKRGLRGAERLNSCTNCNIPSGLLSRRGYSTNFEAPKKRHTIRNTLVLLGATTGAVVGYAKFDPEFRKQIEEISPGFNEFIKLVTQEERSFEESYNVVSTYVSSLYNDLVGEAPSPKPSPLSVPPIKPIPQRSEAKRQEAPQAVSSIPPPPPITSKPPAPAKSSQPSQASLANSDEEIRQAATGAILALQDATAAVKSYSTEVGKVLDSQIENRNPGVWSEMRNKTTHKDNLVSAAEKAVSNATERLSKVRAAVESSPASQVEKDRLRRLLSAATSEVEAARRELDAQKQSCSVTSRYWSKVEDARRLFQDEIEALFPNAKITDKKIEAADADIDLFLTHVFKHVVFYQRELARLEATTEQQLRRTLDHAGESINEEVLELRVKQAIDKERRRLEEELQKKLLIARSEQEKGVSELLKRQLETAQDHLSDVLSAKEADLERRVARKIDERDAADRDAYDRKLATYLSQLKALEVVLTDRIEADKNAHRAHVLFSACQSLFRALRSGEAGSHWSEQLRPLNPELSAVSNAVGGSDQLVSTVLSSVPAEARMRGVYPETALRERFLRVEQVSRRVALVPETGGSLFRYLLSYLQSTLLFAAPAIPTKELKDEAVDVAKLDTYDLLERARYWVDRGDFKMSLRYMNLLRGASRAVASQWMDETRIYLETQLVVNTLMAHAAATGMLFL